MDVRTRFLFVLMLLIAAGAGMLAPGRAAFAQGEATPTETAAPTAEPTATPPPPTATASPEPPTPTTQPAYARPVVVIATYLTRPEKAIPGGTFELDLKLLNSGQQPARNILVTFVAGDFIPLGTGGVQAVNEIHPNNKVKLTQGFTASGGLGGLPYATLQVNIAYTDANGTGYSETFVLNIPLVVYSGGPGATPTPTPTATSQAVVRPQLVISAYTTDVSPLQSGSQFVLTLQVSNLGNAPARRVLMIAGGGTLAANGDGTPGPGSVSSSGGDFTNFSPLGVSNVQSIGDLPAGSLAAASQPLIVNATTNPGAYSFKISFFYSDDAGHVFLDDQVITLLVYSIPFVEINFYRDPNPIFSGQPNVLPVQVVNLGKRSVVLGTMRITSANADVMGGEILVGALETGGYYPLDATILPYQGGPLAVNVQVDYIDDFNQQQTITKTLTLDVQEMGIIEPPLDGGGDYFPPPAEPETWWQKLIRFLKGLIGLDSGAPSEPAFPSDGEIVPETGPLPGGGGGVILPAPGKGP